MIKLQAIGHLGKDAILNNANGKSVINFSVAHSEKIKDVHGNVKDKTIWVDCAYWTEKTAILPYLVKGIQVYVEGNPDVRAYTTNSGVSGANLVLRITNIQLLGGNQNNQQQQNQQQNTQQSSQQNFENNLGNKANEFEPLDDLPF